MSNGIDNASHPLAYSSQIVAKVRCLIERRLKAAVAGIPINLKPINIKSSIVPRRLLLFAAWLQPASFPATPPSSSGPIPPPATGPTPSGPTPPIGIPIRCRRVGRCIYHQQWHLFRPAGTDVSLNSLTVVEPAGRRTSATAASTSPGQRERGEHEQRPYNLRPLPSFPAAR